MASLLIVIVGFYRRVILIIVTPHARFVQLSEITQHPAPGKFSIPNGPGQENVEILEEHRIMGHIDKPDTQWQSDLTPEQYQVLREEGTERRFTSPLNTEYRKGAFVCAGCGQPLFKSEMKYDSKTGWPSFFTAIPGALETKVDRKLFTERTEYHCAQCGGHQGHVFEDGPDPTGLRYCNNGVALKFMPE
ncbi:MAG: peptide-methionine (R)-S-oxide reductase MsrB [Betaproteobacteria bacterium]|nr:peptide-methionine (R)-S-oxide reductase MsrB [Betaproteobacteria bacterium]